MTYLVDTDRVVDYLKGKPNAVELLTRLASKGLAISIITFGEIYEGIYFGQDPKKAEKGFIQFLRGVSILSLSRKIMKNFALIRGTLRQKGELIGDLDMMIAAIAIGYDLVLISGNKKHFQKVKELKLFDA